MANNEKKSIKKTSFLLHNVNLYNLYCLRLTKRRNQQQKTSFFTVYCYN